MYRKCTVPNTVALTFVSIYLRGQTVHAQLRPEQDDGPHAWLFDISDALSAAGAQGTFFFNGNNCWWHAPVRFRARLIRHF